MVRSCVCCATSIGINCQTVDNEDDKRDLVTLNMIQHEPRARATWFVCHLCSAACVGLSDRLLGFAIQIAAGLLHFCQRLYPNEDLANKCDQRVVAYMQSAAFSETRHGAADWRLDRMSLYLYGPLADNYGDDKLGYFFCLLFARSCCNDSSAFQAFLKLWLQRTKKLLSIDSWNEELAIQLLKETWDNKTHDMGYFLMLPQLQEIKKKRKADDDTTDFQIWGCRLMSRLQQRLTNLSGMVLPWERKNKPRDQNDSTLHFLRQLLDVGNNGGGFWVVVVARDLGVVFGNHIFEPKECSQLGENGKAGLYKLIPNVGRQISDHDKLHTLNMYLIHQLQILANPLLELVPSIQDLQFTEHNCCEFMQQHHRKNANSDKAKKKTPRCDKELGFFFLRSCNRLGLPTIPLQPESQQARRVSDEELLDRLRAIHQSHYNTAGWCSEFVDRLCSFAEKTVTVQLFVSNKPKLLFLHIRKNCS